MLFRSDCNYSSCTKVWPSFILAVRVLWHSSKWKIISFASLKALCDKVFIQNFTLDRTKYKKNIPDISNKICFWKLVFLQKYFSNDTIKRKYTQTSITDRKWNSDKNSAFYHFGRWVRSSFSGCLISLKGKDKNNSIFCDQ